MYSDNWNFIVFQMNLASTKTDISLWPMKWIPRSPNWLVINTFRFVHTLKGIYTL